MKRQLSILLLLLLIGCSDKIEKSGIKKITFQDRLESIKSISDSTYNRYNKDSTIRYETYRIDSNTTAFAAYRTNYLLAIVSRFDGNDTSVAEYYMNGQLMADLNFEKDGTLDGPATYYYGDGRIKTTGEFVNGKRQGRWRNYDEAGDLIEILIYDQDGKIEKKEKVKTKHNNK